MTVGAGEPQHHPTTGHFVAQRRVVATATALGAVMAVPYVPRTRPGSALRIGAVLLACYLSALLAVNLSTNPLFSNTPLGKIGGFVFPRIGTSSTKLDTVSIQYEWDTIQANYVYRNVGSDKATQGAEAGIVAQLQTAFNDRFLAFRPADTNQALQDDLNNQRTGSIGIAIDARCSGGNVCATGQTPTLLVITDVLTGQPADAAGVHRGDVLVGVDSTQVSSLGALDNSVFQKLTSLVRGTAGTPVTLTVKRGTDTLKLTATRGNLVIKSVFAQKIGTILYIEIVGFDADTGDLVQQLVHDNIAGATGIVLDLRGNGGGYVDAAQKVVSQFITPSSDVKNVVVRRGRMDPSGDPSTAQKVQEDAVLAGGEATKPPMVVLVDGNSASASEITTAALRDYHRATIVGSKTFGKGTVQADYTLPDGNDLHLTIEKWYGPNNENIEGVGITPDDVVALPNPDARFRIDAQAGPATDDPQLQAALKILHGA